MTTDLDFIKTIEDDAEVENLSEDSDAEIEVSCVTVMMDMKRDGYSP